MVREKNKMMSMTGFGAASIPLNVDGACLHCEIKSLNSRMLDLQIKSSLDLGSLDLEIRQICSRWLSRGRVEVLLSLSKSRPLPSKAVELDDGWHNFKKSIERRLGGGKLSRQELIVLLPIFSNLDKQHNADSGFKLDQLKHRIKVLSVIETAVGKLIKSRLQEGKRIRGSLEQFSRQLSSIRNKVDQCLLAREKTAQALMAGKFAIFKSRLDSEGNAETIRQLLVEFFMPPDISEEVQRISSHMSSLRECLRLADCGKKIEFLCQELQRELSTVGAKAQDASLQHLALEGKLVVEKIREQAQNVC